MQGQEGKRGGVFTLGALAQVRWKVSSLLFRVRVSALWMQVCDVDMKLLSPSHPTPKGSSKPKRVRAQAETRYRVHLADGGYTEISGSEPGGADAVSRVRPPQATASLSKIADALL